MWQRITFIVDTDQQAAANTLEWVLNRSAGEGDVYRRGNFTNGTQTYFVSSGLWRPATIVRALKPDFVSSRVKPARVGQAVWDARQARIQKAIDALLFRKWEDVADLPNKPALLAKKAGVGRVIGIIGNDPRHYLAELGLTSI